ncbi:hypothetical protein O4J56_03405 [Nocardiopsis sp. RSe5-2]|uniref:Integral membrane protein n=1 Tax=Nocardiopsis endophytica TaxID=3018445 RepID=A0ABT4TYB5_9ACTN|nr:hypothetical protein [Nocardiopsis endophytica]MDA2809679.1 hypothetical protein [Nocardiopsis endophytica]
MIERPERVVLDYLSRVGDAAYGAVPSRRRAAFLGEVRRRVDEACRREGAHTTDDVRRVLKGIGDPVDLVRAEIASGGADGDGADGDGADAEEGREPGGGEEDGGAASSVIRERTPPPWRGGPHAGWLGARAGTVRTVSVRPEHGTPITALRDWEGAGRGRGRRWSDTVAAFREHPSELLVLALYGGSALADQSAFLWAVGAAMVVLSRVWPRRDKWVLVGVPPAATLVAMAFWRGDAPYIDQIVLESLTSTGVVGLRAAAAACAVYAVVRIGPAAHPSGHRRLNPPE